MNIEKWEPPDVTQSQLTYAVTSSFVEQFAQGHTIDGILRELVQNEYDAGGSSLSVVFARHGLEVHGDGRVIDRAGWRRLTVMLGTGRVVGDDRDVPAKTNGIGSKNHGLRSLFLIGNEIYIRSGGYQTVLDLRRGALREPRPDPTSADISGAHIFVPYREAQDGQLEAYGPAREERDMQLLADNLAPTLVKLAQPNARRSLRSVTVSADRHDRVLKWRQNVRLLRRHRLGGPILHRTIEFRDDDNSTKSASARKITEIEYQKSFGVPPAFRAHTFPDYFRVPGGRLRMGISLRLKRKRLDLGDPGLFYYPIGSDNSLTGSAISLSAPFEMNPDRTALMSPANSSWNEWLIGTASEYVLDLLTNEWLSEFNGDGLLALEENGQYSVPDFSDKIRSGLQSRECWPVRKRETGTRRPRLRKAKEIMMGSSPELDVLVGDDRRLDSRLADPRVIEMARRAGAKDFTIASAIRLRCAGEDASHLKTKLDGSAALRYDQFPDDLMDIEVQEEFGRALDVPRQLTQANRSDLREAPTTLTAAGTLAAPAQPLWVVDDAVASASPVPTTQRLHPILVQYKAIRRLCEPHDLSAWASDVASHVVSGTVRKEDREALYQYLLQTTRGISRSVWPMLRQAPILRDHRGKWVSAADMIQPRTAGAARIEQALHFPSHEIINSPMLMRQLRIRSKLAGNDLVRYAHIVVEEPALAPEFETTLNQLRILLGRPVVAALRSISFLQSTRGDLVAPEEAYVYSAHLVSCVGESASFVAGRHVALYERLGCRDEPDSSDILSFLDSLRDTNSSPQHPEILYPALAEALRREGRLSRQARNPILFVDGGWHNPADVLIGRRHRQIFLDAVPVISAGALDHVYRSLGAHSEPLTEHWVRFFRWMDHQSDAGSRTLRPTDRKAIRLAYMKIGSLPSDVPDSYHAFLDTNGMLHSRRDINARRYLINDDPRMADAAITIGLAIAFADTNDAMTRRFYIASGVSLLTAVRKHIGIKLGEQRSNPPWFQEPRELDRLRQPDFASAVHAVAAASGSHSITTERQLRRRLREITRIIFVNDLKDSYRIGPYQLDVSTDVAIDNDRIVLRFVRSRVELHGHLARAVASMAETTTALQQPLADSIFRLLMSDSPADLERYLAQRGIAWTARNEQSFDDESADGEEADSRAQVAETLKERLLQPSPTQGRTQRPGQPPATTDQQPVKPETKKRQLPVLDTVSLKEADAIDWTPSQRGQTSSGGGGGGIGRLRSPDEQAADQAIGTRGEELVYRAELERVRALGYPEDRVIWTAKSDPLADHDILTVADDGGDMWLEVKSTTGRHGRFEWPRGEFELALRERNRYVLCRVMR